MIPQSKMAGLPPQYVRDDTSDGGVVPANTYNDNPVVVSGTYTPMQSKLSATEAMYYTWRYDSMVNAMANALARPRKFDKDYVDSGRRDAVLAELQYQYKGRLNQSMIDTAKEISSLEEEDWFKQTVHNKMLVEQSRDDHFIASLGGDMLAPENLLIGTLTRLGPMVVAVPKLAKWASKGFGRVATYGAGGAVSGGLQAVPGVQWNYDDPNNIYVATALGGALGVALAARINHVDALNEIASTDPSKASVKRVSKGLFGFNAAELLSKSDELNKISGGQELGSKLLGTPQFGLSSDIDSAGSRSAALSARMQRYLRTLEQDAKERGLVNQGFWDNFRQVLGMESTATKLARQENARAQQLAEAFLGNCYNYNRMVEAKANTTKELIDLITKEKEKLGVDLDLEEAGSIPDLIKRLNSLQEARHVKELEDYNAKTLSGTAKKEEQPVRPTPYQMSMQAAADLVEPNIDNLPKLARDWVEAYRNAGLAEELGKMVNTLGNGILDVAIDKNYFHTRFSLDKVDALADRIGPEVRLKEMERLKKLTSDEAKASLDATYKVLRQEQRKLKKQLRDLNDYGSEIPDAEAQKESLLKRLMQVDGLVEEHYHQFNINKKKYNEALSKSNAQWKEQSYEQILEMVGEQMAKNIKLITGEAIDPKVVGAFLLAKYVNNVGHDTLKRVISRTTSNATEDVATSILKAGGDLDIPKEAFDALENGVNLNEVIKKATGLFEMHSAKLIGEASAFQQRFLWDYMTPSKSTGVSLSELLDGDILQTATRNIQEETGRVALSWVDITDEAGKTFFLNNGVNLNRAQDIIYDLAMKNGYDSKNAEDLAKMTFDALLGRAMGETLGPRAQALIQLAQMIQLRNSGIYNVADTAQIAHQWGTAAVARNFGEAIRMGLGTTAVTKQDGKELKNIVSQMYAMEARIRPDVSVIAEDMTSTSSHPVLRGIMNLGQYQRWVNFQAPVAQWQANLCGILYQESLEKALKSGNLSALKMEHTFTAHEWEKMLKNYSKHGMNVEDWEDALLTDKVIRNCFDTITNTALQVRRGDRPRFLDTAVGKIAFAYQSFVWASHNKLLRRYANTNGNLNAALFIARQVPLSVMLAIGITAMNGKDPFSDPTALANKAINSTSALGLIAYAGNIVTAGIGGTSPMLGVVNTGIQGTQQLVMNGDPTTLLKNVPLLGGFLPYRMALGAMIGTMDD